MVLLDQPDHTPSLDELRRKTNQKMFALKLVRDAVISRTNCNYADSYFAYICVTSLLDASTAIKCGLTFDLFINAIVSMGTERHRHFIERCSNGDVSIFFSFLLKQNPKMY